jgi:hypothetical protein
MRSERRYLDDLVAELTLAEHRAIPPIVHIQGLGCERRILAPTELTSELLWLVVVVAFLHVLHVLWSSVAAAWGWNRRRRQSTIGIVIGVVCALATASWSLSFGCR